MRSQGGREQSGRDQSGAEPLTERVRRLEQANDELRRVNAALAREKLGASNTAAVPLLRRLRAAESKLAGIESSLSWRITVPLRALKRLAQRVWWVIRPGSPPT